jgi:hypothetical protein
MRRRDQWIVWIRAVEREGEAAAYALDLLEAQLKRDPSSLKKRGLGQRDFAELQRHRETTYLVRMFAEFEIGLREAWSRVYGETSHPRMVDLLVALGSRRRMPNERLSDAHRVRVCRNAILHDESEAAASLTIQEARRYLCRFFSFLPEVW